LVKPSRRYGFRGISRPEISNEIEPLVDVTTTDKEVRVVVEIPEISKDKIKINAHDNTVEEAKLLRGNAIVRLKYQQKRISKQTDLLTIMGYWK
jgi:HSP20 family molecular chaperone IbpA